MNAPLKPNRHKLLNIALYYYVTINILYILNSVDEVFIDINIKIYLFILFYFIYQIIYIE